MARIQASSTAYLIKINKAILKPELLSQGERIVQKRAGWKAFAVSDVFELEMRLYNLLSFFQPIMSSSAHPKTSTKN